ncbi:uncharacterized protein LOC130013562 [Patella vulgata]|uniref:uncharacterized protein LOC130013562 n=1 Tax=Patella vulgata TaxID=6465 RepID=UPI0024A82648|nr:uncharacterized protein LOC130013562 [Patella vulgata]
MLVIYILLIIFIVGGNILTIIAIWKTEVLRTVANVYVALLAFSDIIAGNSGMNFIIYAVKNKDYRKAFKEILHLDCTLKRTAKVTSRKTNDIVIETF